MMQIPFERVALVAPVLEGANAIKTPVIEGVVARVDSTSVAIVIVALASLMVVDIKVTPVLEGVVAKVDSTSVAVVTVASPLKVVNVTIAPDLRNSN